MRGVFFQKYSLQLQVALKTTPSYTWLCYYTRCSKKSTVFIDAKKTSYIYIYIHKPQTEIVFVGMISLDSDIHGKTFRDLDHSWIYDGSTEAIAEVFSRIDHKFDLMQP